MSAPDKQHTTDCLAAIFKSCDFCFAIVGEDGLIIEANPGLAHLLGCRAQELSGKLFSGLLATPSCEHRQSTEAALKYFFEKSVFIYNSKLVRHDGTAVGVRLISRRAAGTGSVLVEIVQEDRLPAGHDKAAAPDDSFLENIFSAVGDGLYVTDEQGRIVKANPTLAKMLGYRLEELIGRRSLEFIAQAEAGDAACAPELIPELISRGVVENYEALWRKKDGTQVQVELKISLLKNSAGAMIGAVSAVRDISLRKLSESALRASEEQFRTLTESTFDAILSINSQGLITFWNKGARSIFGYEADEILGKPVSLLLPEHVRERDARSLQSALRSGASLTNGKPLEQLYRHKDGREFIGEFSRSAWSMGGELFISAVVRNISERKQVEADLRESEQRFKELADALPQTVFELNIEGIITFVNRTALDAFGYRPSDIDKGMHAMHMIVPEQRITVRENIEKVFAGERLGGQEYMALRKDGTTFPCIIHASPILADGKPQGLRGLLIDITLRKELEEQMNKSNRLASIATLAGGVAQDFNTILSIILGNINLAQHQVAPEDRVSEHLAAAERATLRAKDLTDQLIAFSKGGTALKTALSVEKLLRDAANTALKVSNVACQFSFPPDLQHTELDELQMRQVFINLLINADHAMPEGGSIDVSAVNITVGPGDNLPLPNGAYVKITISDQSIGILNEHLQQLFDPYFTSRQRGSGIGLATTYTIIKNHGGLITVESEFGSGTTFHIFLPACGNKR